MTIIGEVLKELAGMFIADARLTAAVLLLVAIIAGLISVLHVGPLLSGGMLLFGALAILIESADREARSRNR